MINYMNEQIKNNIFKKQRNYKDNPRQLQQSLKVNVEQYNLEILKFEKTYYYLYAILKDKFDNRYVCVKCNDLRCFKDFLYKNISIVAMDNSKNEIKNVGIVSNWNDIGQNARKLIDLKKQLENNIDSEIEMDI